LLAQLVEQVTLNHRVGGSSPSQPTSKVTSLLYSRFLTLAFDWRSPMRQFDIHDLVRKIKSRSVKNHIRYRLPWTKKIFIRDDIFRYLLKSRKFKSTLYNFACFYWLITGKHIQRNGFCLSNYGVWLAVRSNDLTYDFCVDASYVNNLDLMLQSISEETTFVDIGANIGVFSLVAELNTNIVAIYSFEPDLETFSYLEKNVSRVKSNRIFCHNYAVGTEAGDARLTKNPGHSGISRIDSSSDELSSNCTSIKMINHIYLDQVFNAETENYFVKIDVEGYELECLIALRMTDFFPRIRNFFIEFDSGFGKVLEVEEFLRMNKFTESNRWGSSEHWDAHWVKQDSKGLTCLK
jgi:FkbM family methyltransferase